tara:strand:- start:625 stop:1080 length:456 start_codon:yes stop_codon:yes gene_type:complete
MKNYILLIVIFFLTTQCGFKVVNHNDLNQFNIRSFELEGENRINRLIKRNLLFYSKKENNNTFNIKIKTTKTKKILEKNIKNEIVKYQITLSSVVEFYNFSTGKIIKEAFGEQGDFNVGNKNIDTRNNEKKLIEDLIEELSEQMIKKIRVL